MPPWPQPLASECLKNWRRSSPLLLRQRTFDSSKSTFRTVRGRPHPSTECEPHPVALATESLVSVTSVSVSGTLDDDLALLQDHLEENVPCYVLARLDNPPSEWLIISYVPDAAQVRQKVIPSLDWIAYAIS